MGNFIRDHLPDPISYFEAEGLALRGPGKWRTTRCEFHDGSDSMRVSTETGGWVCMACGEKGSDVMAYAMRRHGLEFVEAARREGAGNTPHGLDPPMCGTADPSAAAEAVAHCGTPSARTGDSPPRRGHSPACRERTVQAGCSSCAERPLQD